MNRIVLLQFALVIAAPRAFAQSSFPETEPNNQRVEANLVTGIVAGDSIQGVTTGSITNLGLATNDTADVFRVRTVAQPLGIYQHRLTLTTSTTAGHSGTIRGLNQTGTSGIGSTGGTVGSTDVQVQASSTTSPIPRMCQWYGFGKQEEIYYRVTGVAGSTAPYAATYSTASAPITILPMSLESGSPITISTIGRTIFPTMIHVFDSNLDALPGYSNGSEGPAGPTSQSRLTRMFPAGTYYLAMSSANTAWNIPAPPDEDFISDPLMDFPGSLVRQSPSNGIQDWDFHITAANGQHLQTCGLPTNQPFDVVWYRFTTAPGAPNFAPANDACANAIPVAPSGTDSGLTSAFATHDGNATCDSGGPLSNDVWFTYANTSPTLRLLNLDTCTSTYDTVLSVYAACGGVELACNDDCAGAPCGATSSCLSGVPVQSGQTVHIRIGDKGLGGGAYTLHWSASALQPSNDDCNTPLTLTGPGSYPFDTTAATTGTEGQGATSGCTTLLLKDLWFTYTSNTTGTVTVSTCGSVTGGTSANTKIALYAGAGCPSGAGLACNADDSSCTGPGGSPQHSTVSTNVTCGQVITIQLGNDPGPPVNIFGAFSVTESGVSCTTPTTSFCVGDGTGAACPCGNTGSAGNGCGSLAFAGGAKLTASGMAGASAGTDTWILTATDIPGPTLFFQASGVLGTPANFGDGLLCAAIGIIRLGIVFPTAGAASYPGGLTPNPIHIGGGPLTAGDVRHYQSWYRSVPGLCGPGNYNLTQGLTATWGP